MALRNQTLIGICHFVVLLGINGYAHFSISFKDSAIVNDTCIRLSDVAIVTSDCSPNETRDFISKIVGESAPAGYCRKVNSDDIISYVLKKDFPNYTVVSKHKSIKVSTFSVDKKVGDYKEKIIGFLTDSISWNAQDYKVEIRNENEKWKCLNTPVSVQITGLSNRYPKGNLNLKLLAKQNSKIYTIPVTCFITVNASVVVAKRPILRGEAINSDNCSIERRDITRFGYEPFSNNAILKDMIASRTIPKDAILYDKYLTKLPIVAKDDQVFVIVDRGVVKVSIIMRAREQGAMGDRIWVENENTHKLIKTKIIGKGTVELLQGGKVI